MSSRSPETPARGHSAPGYFDDSTYSGKEIRISEIWALIARRKGVMLLVILASLLLAVSYLFVVQPVYKATVYLLPPQPNDIQGLSVGSSDLEQRGFKQYTPEFVFLSFLANLKSQGLRREFFDEHDLVNHYAPGEARETFNDDRIFDTRFNKNLVVQIDKNTPPSVTVSFRDNNPELAAKWLNQIVDLADKRTIAQFVGDANGAVQAEMKWIQHQLASKLKLAEQRRNDTITVLKEALIVARGVGITDTRDVPEMATKNQLDLSINTVETPLYLRGTKALQAEIEVLASRKTDEPFISGFRDLQERYAFLDSISIDTDKLSAVRIDRDARVPYRAEKPRPLRVLLLALVFGIIFGAILALFLGRSSGGADDAG